MKNISILISVFALSFLGSFLEGLLILQYPVAKVDLTALLTASTILISILLITQGLFTLMWMLFAWDNPKVRRKLRSPKRYMYPIYSFTALIPARHEEMVIGDTIRAIANIDYPETMKEALILCREDDVATILAAQRAITAIGKDNIRIVTFTSGPINKPHALNVGLQAARNAVVAIFDAEDEPHKDIYKLTNTVMVGRHADVVQGGVALTNHTAHWYSLLNVLEYFFWFASGLHFFTRVGHATPLGGNTVFFKKNFLTYVGGWDEACLTEDADIGIRLAKIGANIQVVYDERLVTREETPSSLGSFVRQRTRWNQGFLQILMKGQWLALPSLKQKLTIFYILSSPYLQILLLLYIPFGTFISLTQKLPPAVTLLAFVPFYMFFIQLLTFIVGTFEFTKAHRLRSSIWLVFHLLITFYPYQLVLMYSSIRALGRAISGSGSWEKTQHINAHRSTKRSLNISQI